MDNGTHLFLLGASHHNTPIAIRERLALTNDRVGAYFTGLRSIAGLKEAVLINTCNRLELYAVTDSAATDAAIERHLCEFQAFPPAEFQEHRFALHNEQAIRHLIEVAVGADSQLVGEAEIFGQVKDAYARATEHGIVGAVLNRVFQKGFQAAKYIRSHVPIGAGQVSVATVSVDLAEKIFGDLRDCRVLIAGTGEVGEKTAKALHSRGVTRMTVLSRFAERSAALASTVQGQSGTLDKLPATLNENDIIVGCTTTSSPIITAAMIQAASRTRRIRPVFLIDLGIPRNFDPATSEVDSVFLYDLDDLARIADENLATRRGAVDHCRQLAADKAARIWEGVAPRLPRQGSGFAGESFPVSETMG
jgi:glutamyl-tRNA reductase